MPIVYPWDGQTMQNDMEKSKIQINVGHPKLIILMEKPIPR